MQISAISMQSKRSAYLTRPTFKAGENVQQGQINEELFDKLQSLEDETSVIKLIRTTKDINSYVDKDGNYIIHALVKRDFYEAIKQMLINPKAAKSLLELRGEKGMTPLAMAQSAKTGILLLRKGANVLSLDNEGRPAGLNPNLPAEVNSKVQEVADARLQSAKNNIVKPAVPVAEEAEVAEVVDAVVIPQSEVATVDTPKPAHAEERKFFGMFRPKAGTVETEKKITTPLEQIAEAAISRSEETSAGRAVTLDSIVGLEDIISALRISIIEPLSNSDVNSALQRNQISIPNGIMFVAPAGNGKTTLAKALSHTAEIPLYEASSAVEVGSFIEKINEDFTQKGKRGIVYLRGIDNIYSQGATGETTNTFNRVMTNSADKGALIIMSAECTDGIPREILMPGKIDHIYRFNSPDTETRKKYIESYVQGKDSLKEFLSEENINMIAEKTQGFSIAQIKHIFDDSVLSTLANGRESVEIDELLEKIRIFSKEQNIPEINEYNKTSMYDTALRRYQPTEYDAKDFESIAGMPQTKSSVEEQILKPWQNAEELRKHKIQLPVGGIFTGDPGTSKTYMAKAIAKSLKLPLYTLKMSETGSSYVHETS